MSFEELGVEGIELLETQRASFPLEPSATSGDNYESWLAKQGKVFQEKVLGAARRGLWLDGKIGLTDLTDGRSIPLTIDELADEAA